MKNIIIIALTITSILAYLNFEAQKKASEYYRKQFIKYSTALIDCEKTVNNLLNNCK